MFEKIENYEPDKRKFYGTDDKKYINKIKKEQEKIRKYHKLDPKGRYDKKKDDENITERRKAILSGEQEKRAIKTFNSFTPEEVEIKTFLSVFSSSGMEREGMFIRAYEEYKNGTLKNKSEGKYSANELKEIEENAKTVKISYEKYLEKTTENSKRLEKAFEKYEFLGVYRDEKSGLCVYNFGNKETGQLELFIPGTNEKNKSEIINNYRSYFETTPAQKAVVSYVKELNQKSKNGQIFGDRQYNKGVGSINGHSQGGGTAIYAATHIPEITSLVTDPGPVVELGNYVKDNSILAIIPNNGKGMVNYAEKIYGSNFTTLHQIAGNDTGSGKNQTSLITALPVEGTLGYLSPKETKEFFNNFHNGKSFNFQRTYYNHYPVPENAGIAFKKMQDYSRAVEPKLNSYLNSQKFQEENSSKINQEKNKLFNNHIKKINLQDLVSKKDKKEEKNERKPLGFKR